jgi:hypothetical protein
VHFASFTSRGLVAAERRRGLGEHFGLVLD